MYDAMSQVTAISIHTLTRRVTAYYGPCELRRIDFNPHPRVEGDVMSSSLSRASTDFNPHPHAREWIEIDSA